MRGRGRGSHTCDQGAGRASCVAPGRPRVTLCPCLSQLLDAVCIAWFMFLPPSQNQHPLIALSLPLPAVFSLAAAGSVLPLEDSCGYDNPEWSPGAPSLVFVFPTKPVLPCKVTRLPRLGIGMWASLGPLLKPAAHPVNLPLRGRTGDMGVGLLTMARHPRGYADARAPVLCQQAWGELGAGMCFPGAFYLDH